MFKGNHLETAKRPSHCFILMVFQSMNMQVSCVISFRHLKYFTGISLVIGMGKGTSKTADFVY